MPLLSSLNKIKKKYPLYLLHSSLVSPARNAKGSPFVWQVPYYECPEAVSVKKTEFIVIYRLIRQQN